MHNLQLNLALAEEELGKFREENYGGDEKLLSWSKQKTVAKFELIKKGIEYSMETEPERRGMAQLRLMGIQDYIEWIEYQWECEWNYRNTKRKDCIKALWDYRTIQPKIPDVLQIPWHAPGTYLQNSQ